jgi:hypothetical protein
MKVERPGVKKRGWPTTEKDGNILLMPYALLQTAKGIDDDDDDDVELQI